jgi:hypothetical protein
MGLRSSKQFQLVKYSKPLFWLWPFFIWPHILWAAQEAKVISKRAIIYADKKMTKPVGYVRRGKVVRIGDIARTKAKLYPIVVSGKVAYILSSDLAPVVESLEESQLVSKRFTKGTGKKLKNNYTASLFNYSSQISIQNQNDQLSNKDSVNWQGIELRGETQIDPQLDLAVLLNFLNSQGFSEKFKMIELGLGASYRLLDLKRFRVKLYAQTLAIPFASYELGDQFRVNSYGLSVGTGINTSYLFDAQWGAELFGGVHYSRLMIFNVPAPYDQISPSFLGTRLGIGVSYLY